MEKWSLYSVDIEGRFSHLKTIRDICNGVSQKILSNVLTQAAGRDERKGQVLRTTD